MVDPCLLAAVVVIGLHRRSSSSTASEADDGDAPQPIANFPEGWETYTYLDIRDHFDCGYRSGDNAKTLPTLEDWQLLQRTYTRFVDTSKQWDDPIPPTLGYSLQSGVPVPPPYYPKVSPGKGRGLFASRDIQKGEVVHDGTLSDVVFPDATSWRRFVFSLPREMACDCTDWHWFSAFSDEKDAPYYMLGGINISSLMNAYAHEGGESEASALGISPNALPRTNTLGKSTSAKFYAMRDIKRGEEILTDYYVYETDWSLVGL